MTPLTLLLAVQLWVATPPTPPPAPVPTDEKIDFTWKLAKGDVFYVTLQTDTDAKVPNPPPVALSVDSQSQRTVGVWKVTVATADKDRVALTLEAVSYSSSSNWNLPAEAVKEVADAAGLKFTLSFDTAFRLSKVTDGETWDKLRPKQIQSSGMHTAKGVGRAFEHVFQAVPGGVQGKEWKRKEDVLDKDAGTSDTWTRRAKVGDVKDGVAAVTTETDLTGTHEENGRSIFATYERKAEKCPGSFTFDTRTGRLVRFEETLTVTGLSGGKDQAFKYAATVKTVATLSAKPPK